jgi:hypothetical protein
VVAVLDGRPVFIDVGVETYTAKTFGKDRYSIWTMQSAYHNVPLINGIMQKDGREFAARDVRYRASDAGTELSMDLAPAYPSEARCRRWERSIALCRPDTVRITDRYTLDTLAGEVALTFMTSLPPEKRMDGEIVLRGDAGRGAVLVYDHSLLSAKVETVPLTDAQLKSSWGDRVYRITLVSRRPATYGTFVTILRAEE